MALKVTELKLVDMMEGGFKEGDTGMALSGSGVGKSCMADYLLDRMMRRNDMVENLYLKMEAHLPCEPLSDELLAAMNKSMGFPTEGPHAKDRDYRPYCVREHCEYMPRMMRIHDGFQCWSCKGKWDLNKTLEEQNTIQP